VAPVEENVYELSPEERVRREIKALPGDLGEAIKFAENSELLKTALGEYIMEKLIENKKLEWERYRVHVSDFELNAYLPIL
jgi:glutamine synthetase